jgi:uncharacterized protein with HEPN domain
MRIEDIHEALERITEYVAGLDQSSWQNDRKTIDAVIRNLEIIGEAAIHVPSDVQEQNMDIPWHQMKGMRNLLIHEYFGVDIEVLWKTIQEDIPPLLSQISKLLNTK